MIDKDKLVEMYLDGFSSDSRSFAQWFVGSAQERDIILHFEQDEPVSVAYIVEKPAYLFSKRIQLPYLSAISTMTKHRGQGKIGIVMKSAFEELDLRGATYTVLNPFSKDYYKRFGYVDVMYSRKSTVIGGHDYPTIAPTSDTIKSPSDMTKLASPDAINAPSDMTKIAPSDAINASSDMTKIASPDAINASSDMTKFASPDIANPSSIIARISEIERDHALNYDNYLVKDIGQITRLINSFGADGARCNLVYDGQKPVAFYFASENNIEYYAQTEYDILSRIDYIKGKTFDEFNVKYNSFKNLSNESNNRLDTHIQARVINCKRALLEYNYKKDVSSVYHFKITDDILDKNNIDLTIKIEGGIAREIEPNKANSYKIDKAYSLTIAQLGTHIFSGMHPFHPQTFLFKDKY